VAVAGRASGADASVLGVVVFGGGAEVGAAKLRAVVADDALELPARLGELVGDVVQQRCAVTPARVALGGVQLRPRVAGGDVDGGVLPDRALGALKPADEKAVDTDLFARSLGVDVTRRRGRRGDALVGVAVAGDERQALGARVEPDAEGVRRSVCEAEAT